MVRGGSGGDTGRVEALRSVDTGSTRQCRSMAMAWPHRGGRWPDACCCAAHRVESSRKK